MNRGAVVALVSWLAVVGLGAGLVWFVVSDAGRVVSTAGGLPVATSGPSDVTSEITRTPAPAPSSRSSRPHAKRGATASTSRRPSPPTTSAPARVDPSPAPARKPSRPRRSRPASSPASTPVVVRTWSGSGGSVTVSCTGRTIRLRGASPEDGWRVERGSDGPEEVEITFVREQTQVQVQSSCSGGRPVFHVEKDSDEH